MSLQTTLSSKAQARVPNEILLLIFDFLIDEAVQSQTRVSWLLLYSAVETWTGRLTLGVASTKDALHKRMEPEHRNKVLRQRFRATRLLRQVSKTTRHLIQRKFRPATTFYLLENKPVTALVLPEIDLFTTVHLPWALSPFNLPEPEVAADDERLMLVLQKPNSGAQTVLDYIQQYHVPLLDCLDPARHERLAPTLKMSNLKELWIEPDRTWRERFSRRTRHAGIGPITSGALSILHQLQWAYPRAYSIFRELEKRGVKLYSVSDWDKMDKIMQIFITKDDTQMQWVTPNCSECLTTGNPCGR